MPRTAIIALAMLAAVPAGCSSDSKPDPQPLISVPLPLDPTDHYDFGGWWVGDDHMMVLNRDQSYILYNGLNRYLSPKQRGRWMQLTYASLRLEPYGRYVPDSMRVRVELVNGERTLVVPGLAPMFASDAAPPTPEDDLMGAWGGESGDLHLTTDMRYEFVPSAKYMNPHATVLTAGQRGQWTFIGDELVLRPDSPAFDRIVLKLTTDDDRDILTGELLAFERGGDSIADSRSEDGGANASSIDSSTSLADGSDD